MNYRLLSSGGVQRIEDGALIPDDPANLDWGAYQQWLEKGNKPLPQDNLPAQSKSLSDGDLAALLVRNKVIAQADVDAAIASMAKP